MPNIISVTCLAAALLLAKSYELPGFPAPEPAEVWSVMLDRRGDATLMPGRVPGAAAWGSYSDKIHQTGWGLLDLHSSEDFGGDEQSYAVGFLEGALTHERISHSLTNTWGIDFAGYAVGTIPADVRQFVVENDLWMREQVSAYPDEPYWQTLGYLLSQRRGIADGYNTGRQPGDQPELSEMEMYMLSLINADMDDLVAALHFREAEHRAQAAEAVVSLREIRQRGHCSVLVQPAPNNTDLWVSHVTWDVYRNMLRMVKYLDMPLPGVAVRRVAFSSFPGNLYSADGFHVTDANLTVVETTISNFNTALWDEVRPQSVMTWARAMIANRLATDGSTWTELQVRHNSGTCNNQWIVVDYNRFVKGGALPSEGLIWISETMPGHSQRADVSGVVLSQGSWSSYNIPFFQDIWTVGGWGAKAELQPDIADEFSYTEAPRAKMFRRVREASQVTSLDSFMQVMRFNEAPNDPLAVGDACNGISARCDMNPQNTDAYNCFGAHDAKVTAAGGGLSFYGILSPTYDNHRPFRWSEQNASAENCMPHQHIGHPDAFDFGWYSFPDAVQARVGERLPPTGVGLSASAAQAQRLRSSSDESFVEVPQLPGGSLPSPPAAAAVAAVCAIGLAVFFALGREHPTAVEAGTSYLSIE